MKNQIDLFGSSPVKPDNSKPTPPPFLKRYISKVLHHDTTAIIYTENKGTQSPSVAHFFTGTNKGQTAELTPTIASGWISEYPIIKQHII